MIIIMVSNDNDGISNITCTVRAHECFTVNRQNSSEWKITSNYTTLSTYTQITLQKQEPSVSNKNWLKIPSMIGSSPISWELLFFKQLTYNNPSLPGEPCIVCPSGTSSSVSACTQEPNGWMFPFTVNRNPRIHVKLSGFLPLLASP